MAGFRIETRLRPAYVELPDGKYIKVLFHCWSQEGNIYSPSIHRGGHNDEAVPGVMAIVERENGWVRRVRPEFLKFVPGEFSAYSWGDEEMMQNDDKNQT